MSLCHDLIRTLKSPFDVPSSRLNWYISFSLILPLIIVSTLYGTSSQTKPPEYIRLECNDETPTCDDDQITKNFNYCLILMFQVFTLTAFYSVAFAFKRLVRKGVSVKARWAFFKKHLVYIIVIMAVWIL